ncbi:MAG: YolD-like family protein [Epulopiscium sp.]|nr:YolD-like family protein [Candidatus Epulonipiscium sp.]
MTNEYEDIIHMPRHISNKRKPMPMISRAAQFSPFAALTGHEEAVKETARKTEKRIELDEHMKKILDDKLKGLLDKNKENISIKIKYFKPDNKKDGGAYVTYRGTVNKIDQYRRIIHMDNNKLIPMDEIINIEEIDF